MIQPADFYGALRGHGFDFFTGVPDSLLKDLCAFINDRVAPSDHVINANEGSAVALAAGYHLATGRFPVVYLQNSGTGNAINPLLSLADPAVYGIPMLLLVGWRAEPGVKDEPQHVTQGRVQEALHDAIELPYRVLGPESTDLDGCIEEAVATMRSRSGPYAFLIRKGTFSPYESDATVAGEALSLRRSDAVELVLSMLGSDDLIVSTTGMTSREVFASRERRGQPHDGDFLTVGSMGHASQIALGLAQQRPERAVYCLDGDGAVLMHMGSLAIIGTQQPVNLRHVVINNGAHDSVGGQPTAASDIDLSAVAAACGYRSVARARNETEVREAMASLAGEPGPTMLEIRVSSQPHTDAGRPTSTPAENKAAFMKALGVDVK